MTLAGEKEPFVLLDDARLEGAHAQGARPARLYRRPRAIIEARTADGVIPALEQLRQATRDGAHAAGYLGYEAGFALDPRLAPLARASAAGAPPLLWFGLFDAVEDIAPADVPALFAGTGEGHAEPLIPSLTQDAYRTAIGRVLDYIRAGDMYQANLSFQADVPLSGDLIGLYARVRAQARAGHGALVRTGTHSLLSFSPELFFALSDGALVTRPMKGTAPRHPDPVQDAAAAATLAADAKQRAENLMIVDLLRNDLSRVAATGSVSVPQLFAIETYPTVHQMTSTVTATLRDGLDAIDVIAALFPCGSITGAPKLRAMEVIDEVERRPRGPYTGSMGRIDPCTKGAEFNVAIRTICVEDGASVGALGLGSGVVADSSANGEWSECLDKSRFLYDDAALEGGNSVSGGPR